LRKWFQHDPEQWDEFRRRYFTQLEHNSKGWQPILQAAREGLVTLLFSARDLARNNAVALRTFLDRKTPKIADA
jgi:uncharacterized protein YeaO (DUF488 family)